MSERQKAFGTFFDGRTPERFDVELSLSDDTANLRISNVAMGEDHLWPLQDVREHRDQALRDGAVFACRDKGEARLTVTDGGTLASIRAMCPQLHTRDAAPQALRRVAFWGLAAVASVLLIVFVIIPSLANRLAVLIPVEREVALGRSVMTQVEQLLGGQEAGDLTCTGADGVAALQNMTARLAAQADGPYEMQVRVFDHDMINAFAVPGGQIVLFVGLLRAADSAEMVAGVLAHEMGHVVHRDPTRLMLRAAGSAGILAMLLGDFTGGAAVLVAGEQLISAQYRQDAETEADAFAHRVLADAGLPAAALADFFRLVRQKYGDIDGVLSHLVSHPDLSGRAQKADAADVAGDDFTPVLRDDEWQALRGICAG